MGMTNEQFQVLQARTLRVLERAVEEVEKDGKSPTLNQLVEDIKNELKKP